jgi:hypothetical protein
MTKIENAYGKPQKRLKREKQMYKMKEYNRLKQTVSRQKKLDDMATSKPNIKYSAQRKSKQLTEFIEES